MYDIIGDIHGHATQLEQLLLKLDYQLVNDSYQHPDGRQVIFVGDLIDRGSQIRETLHIVKTMCDHGHAQCIMGNHEYNAICFHTPHIEKGGFFRDHSSKEIKQHIQTIEQFNGHELEWEMYLEWFKTLPLFLELPSFNVVHAYWNEANIDWINQHYTTMDFTFLSRCCNKENEAFRVIEETLKGIETALPNGITNPDKEGNHRGDCRVKWWMPLADRQTMNDVLIPCPEALTQTPLSIGTNYATYRGSKTVFFGHYSLKYAPIIENQLAICTDYNSKQGVQLLACRVDLKNDKLEIELIY